MQFVTNLNNLTVDDQYFMDVPVASGTPNAPTGNIGLVGTFSRGPYNTPVLVTSYTDLVNNFGDVDSSFQLTGAKSARAIFQQGNTNVYVVRVASKLNPSVSATVDLFDTTDPTPNVASTLQASTPGSWGNGLVVSVTAGSNTGTFKISLQYGSETETWDNVVTGTPTDNTITNYVLISDVFGANGSSTLAQLVTAENAPAPSYSTLKLQAYTMSGGKDDGATADSDYVGGVDQTTGAKTGISALDSAPINLILAAEQFSDAINTELMNKAEASTTYPGVPRIAIITFDPNSVVGNLSTKTSSIDTDRAIAVFPWVQIFDTVTGKTQTVSPVGFFAGVLVQQLPHQSPGNKPVVGILGADPNKNLSPSDLATLVNDRINAIGVQTPAGQIGIRGGLTLSKVDATSQIYVRRMKDYIDQLVSSVGGQYVDLPITDDVMRQVYQTVDNILQPMKSPITPSDQMIADYKIVCDSTNNPSTSTAQNRLICDYAVKLLNMNRFMIFRTQIGSGVVITKQS